MIGHCDWLAGNLRWNGDELLVVHDWDSVIAESEAVLAGFAAALYPAVSAETLPTVEETQRFLTAYCDARGRELSADELQRAWAAGAWTLAYDARCQHAAGRPVISLTERAAGERLRRAGCADLGTIGAPMAGCVTARGRRWPAAPAGTSVPCPRR